MMTVSDSYRDYVLEQLSRVRPVMAKRLFSSVGIYAAGRMFALIHDDILYLRADEESRAEYEAEGCQPFRPFGDRKAPMPYYELPEDVLEEGGERLRQRVNRAVQASIREAKPKRSKRIKPGPGASIGE
ncbi:TfoX/Sxy family protein [Paenibacillus thermoaerophilus]|uniref:TfoX/Sxy family protein n=1 Tax=Paenibacillus thermoaerophilus TaxID=1215385 RepID=A0ABW2V540_9BACL|nr:TfoX/Sxy family protein [Paenibacillus thermoaerophilus]TMV17665.1 TfoX/Sxy family protein [Paenibacillus thermoaerophilus]